MNEIRQTITLTSDYHYGHHVPSDRLGRLLVEIQESVRHSVAMAFRGQSATRGRCPAWFNAATDLRLVGYSGQDETTLEFQVPTLGSAAPSLYQQGEFFWTERPSPEDTGFDLLGDVLTDISEDNEDSDRFDKRLLRKLQRFGPMLDRDFRDIRITSRRHPSEHPARLDARTITQAKMLHDATPPPQGAMIVGRLDMIRASTQTFGLLMEGGREVRCVLAEGDVADLCHLLRKRAFVSGRVVFRASGSLLRIEAEQVREATDQDAFFARLPTPARRKFDLRRVLHEQRHKKGVAAILGQWPGDESDEEIDEWLKQMD
jgi:hypothetical protein